MADRANRVASDLADALRDRVGHRVNLVGLLIEQQVVVAEVRSAHVPMKILGLHVQREYVGQDCVQASGYVLRRLLAEIGGRDQGRCAPALEGFSFLCALGHGSIPRCAATTADGMWRPRGRPWGRPTGSQDLAIMPQDRASLRAASCLPAANFERQRCLPKRYGDLALGCGGAECSLTQRASSLSCAGPISEG